MGRQAIRATTAAAVAVVGAAIAVAMGAPPAAALLALLAGAAAYALAPWPESEPGTPSQPPPNEPRDDLPGLAELLHAVDDPMLVVRDRRVLAANAAARTLLGDHIEGVDVRLAIRHPAAAERLTGPVTSESAATRTELVGLGDPDRQWAMTVTPLPDASRLVRLSDQSPARAAEQMRVDFVANASHELRTPLATLLGFLETLLEGEEAVDPETRQRFLRIMFDEATRMRSLVGDLMSLSRIEAERFALPRDPVALMPLIEEVRAALAQLLEQREANLVVDNQAGSAVVQGDGTQLAQMLNNLLVNALKYGRAGSAVRVLLEESDELIRISVIDQGEGIPAEHIPRLTERFYRVDAGRSRSVGGTGLGLAIVKHIVLRHRGRLEIHSTLGEGTNVQVYLPKAEPPPV